MSIYESIAAERRRAHELHGHHGGSMEDQEWDAMKRYTILAEEVGEVAKEFNDADDEGREVDAEALEEELIQVAAMAAAWAEKVRAERERREAERLGSYRQRWFRSDDLLDRHYQPHRQAMARGVAHVVVDTEGGVTFNGNADTPIRFAPYAQAFPVPPDYERMYEPIQRAIDDQAKARHDLMRLRYEL